MADVQFQNTTATKKVFNLNKRIRAVAGGTSASKTISILVWIIDYAQSTKNEIITVVAESYPHLKLGAIRDFRAIMTAHGYWRDKRWNDSNHTYTFETGTQLEFISFDKFGKAHGPRRDILYINEANNIPHDIADQLITRTRKIVWMDWNPTNEFWFYTEMLNRREDLDFLTLTYKDNEALDDVTIREIESHKDNKAWWTVYGEGKLGTLEEQIYSGWQIISDIPHEARIYRYGLDFGYTNDPTAIIAIYEYNGGYIFDEVAYQRGMSNQTIADLLKNQPNALVVADSAEPKSIDEIASYGISIVGANKGQGSVFQGIQFVQSQRCSITARSVNTIKAYRNYKFLRDKKTNQILNEPDDSVHEWSNAMDAIRYGLNGQKQRVTDLPLFTFYGN